MTADSDDQKSDPQLDGSFARSWAAGFEQLFAIEADLLGDLDRRAGDGDFGRNLQTALGRAARFVDTEDPQTFSDVFFAVSRGFLHTGGTSGPLFGMWFRDIAKSARTVADGESASVGNLATGVAAGLATIQRLAGARVGDATMIDALAPAGEALDRAATAGLGTQSSIAAAAEAAIAGALTTRDLVARRGRASYVGEVSRGVLDPGAATVALFFTAGQAAASGSTADSAWLRST